MKQVKYIVNCASVQQMRFIEWFSDEYPDFFNKIEKEFWEEQGD